MTPRQFILANSDYFVEAVANGLDIRMEENEWLEWMERYAHFKQATTRILFYCDKQHLGPYEFTSVPRLGDVVKIKSQYYTVIFVAYECDTSHMGLNWVHIDLKKI